MIRPVRFLLALAAGASLLAGPAVQAQDGAPPLAQRDKVWTQTYVRIAPDPAAKFGVLPNGFRYVIVPNATPSKQASFRLRVGTGSLEETDAQQGLAHFIEHMAFNGSTHVPQGEMVRILERHGLAFGADTNASTDTTQTVYQLDVPQADQDTLDTVITLMRETAGELTLAQSAMDTERGVVLSEERARDTPAYRASKARLEFLYKGELVTRRMPIGQVDVLRAANAAALRGYYDSWYRPDRMTLVAVGDFDPIAVENAIKAKFSDLTARAPAAPEPNLGQVARRGTEARLFIDPGVTTSVSISWLKPYDGAPDSLEKRRKDLVEAIAFQVLNRRLQRLARGDNPPFLNAGAGSDDDRSGKLASLSVTSDPAHWQTALAAAEEARRRAVQYGVRQDEVDREVTEFRVTYQNAADAAATRRTPRVANELVQSLDDDEVYTSPAQDLAIFKDAVQNLSAVEVSEALKTAFTGQGPLIFMATSKPVEGGEAAVLSAFNAAEAQPVTPPPIEAAKTWPYTNFGKPGVVVDTKDVVDLETTFVRFQNGVRLTVKPTKFRDQQILVSVRIGDGRIQLPKDRQTPGWAAGSTFTEGGLKDIDNEDMEQVLASKIYSVQMGIGDDAFTLSGATRPQDFDTQMQVLTAYVAAPGWRPEAFQRMKTVGVNMVRQLDATPGGVIRRDLPDLLHSGDPRWAFPTAAQIDAAKLDDVKAMLQQPLADGPIEVVVVGDVDVDRAIKVVGDTLGALPPRSDAPPPAGGRQIRFPVPTANPVERLHNGRADQAEAYIAWPTGDFFANPQDERALRIAQLVMQRRLVDTIRAQQGATYSPSSDWESSLVYPGYGYVSASVEIPPDKVDSFYTQVSKIAADLRTKEISPDELERARKPRIDAIEKAQQTNEYWLGQLSGAQEDPRLLDAIRASMAGLERVRAADVERVAQQYLTDARAWRMVVKPGPNALPAPAIRTASNAEPLAAAAPEPAPAPAVEEPAPPVQEEQSSRVVGPPVEPTPSDAPPYVPPKPPRPKAHRG